MNPDVPPDVESSELHRPEHRAEALTAWLAAQRTPTGGLALGPVTWLAETGSTNADLLEAAAANAPAGAVRIADFQSAGRGRRDRTWLTAPDAALMYSVLLRVPAADLATSAPTVALSLAAVDALHGLGFGSAQLKWPNDIVVDRDGAQAKLAGVLAQSVVVGSWAGVVVGMGLNVRAAALGALVPDRPTAALDQLGPAPDRVALAAAILGRFQGWRADDPAIWDRYRTVSATIGTEVRVVTDADVIEGTATGVDQGGALLVQTSTGVETIVAGDVVSLRPGP